MAMTVVITRDVSPRFRGFLGSCMLEIAPGVYTAPGMTVATRTRVRGVLEGWWRDDPRGQVIMTWQDAKAPAGQAFVFIGLPVKELADCDGLWLARSELTAAVKSVIFENRDTLTGRLADDDGVK